MTGEEIDFLYWSKDDRRKGVKSQGRGPKMTIAEIWTQGQKASKDQPPKDDERFFL